MCGIVTMWGNADELLVDRMLETMRHRGPDGAGRRVDGEGRCALGHRRLSIMDPSGGAQPIASENDSIHIAANGEIYNYPFLRPGLTRGHALRTGSDSEAILHLYEDHRSAVVDHLDGMYAFVVADEDSLFAARDPIGIKPLYYGEREGSLLLASEVKAFPPDCSSVKEFPPGTCYSTRDGFSTFYTVPAAPAREEPLQVCVERLRSELEQAVGKRLMSDVPLGAFLSGGLDSSIIAALAKKHMDELHTFSVGIEGSPDLQAARIVARHLGTVHHEYVLSSDEIRAHLDELIYHLESFDQDLVRSAVPCYFTSRLASRFVKVILTGEGADELFGGYTYYKEISDAEDFHAELSRSVASLHNINLQRVDRMTMAHSVEGRVPFLDTSMIEFAQSIPPRFKLRGEPPVEKWILRKAFEDLLPSEIVWREKAQFDEGSGTADLLADFLTGAVSPAQVESYRASYPAADLRSAEECAYFRSFLHAFDDPQLVLSTVGRWSHRPF